jgi:hypothetical protein
MGFLDYLTEEFVANNLLTEALSDEPPKKASRVIATLAGKDEFLFTLYSEHTLWEATTRLPFAGVRPYGDGHHFVFAYNPQWFESATAGEIYYILGHEIYHILRDHTERSIEHSAATGKDINHHIMNIAMDALIDKDLKDEGTLGGFQMEMNIPSFTFRGNNEGSWGDLEGWVNDNIAKGPEGKKPDPPVKYDGPKMAEPLYDWIIETLKDHGIDLENPEESGEEGDPQPNYPQVGSVIQGPDGTYGEVTSVDEDTKQVTGIRELTREEAYDLVRSNG